MSGVNSCEKAFGSDFSTLFIHSLLRQILSYFGEGIVTIFNFKLFSKLLLSLDAKTKIAPPSPISTIISASFFQVFISLNHSCDGYHAGWMADKITANDKDSSAIWPSPRRTGWPRHMGADPALDEKWFENLVVNENLGKNDKML